MPRPRALENEEPTIQHDLRRGATRHPVDMDLWLCALDLAALRGWNPLGTRVPRASVTTFTRPAGSSIAAEDALAIASGLEAELPAIDDSEQPLGDHPFGEEHTEALLRRRGDGGPVSEEDVRAAREILSGAPKREAKALVAFLRGGAFSVE